MIGRAKRAMKLKKKNQDKLNWGEQQHVACSVHTQKKYKTGEAEQSVHIKILN